MGTNRCFFFLVNKKAACGLEKETLSLSPISPQWAFQLGNYSHVKGDSAESPGALWEHLSPTDANYLAREPSHCVAARRGPSLREVCSQPMWRLINGQAESVKQVERKRNKWGARFSSRLFIYAFVFSLADRRHVGAASQREALKCVFGLVSAKWIYYTFLSHFIMALTVWCWEKCICVIRWMKKTKV